MSAVAGLALGVRGIVGKEVRSRSRGWRPMLLLTFYLAVLALAVVTVLGVAVAQTGTISPNLGQLLFSALASGSVLLVAFIAPALTAGAVSGERERRTLDLLLVTRASPLGLATGKLAGAMLWVIYLLVASLPALGIVYLFGGVPLMTVIASLVVTIATALGYSALGLLLSAVFRRTVVATVLAYGAVMVTTVLLPIVAASIGLTGIVNSFYFPGAASRAGGLGVDIPSFGFPPPSAWVTFFSPVLALISVLGALFGSTGNGYVGAPGLLSTYIVRNSSVGVPLESVTSLAPWIFNALICFGFALVALLLSANSLRPKSSWRPVFNWRRAPERAHGS
jgi:ABC-type transport system involved in multi-copper enzyme maturation permease subunit